MQIIPLTAAFLSTWPCKMAQLLLGLFSKEESPYLLLYLFHSFPQGRVQIEQGSLTIRNVSLSDAGMYQCVAENRHGSIYASAELSVIGKFTFLSAAYFPKTGKA